MFTKSETEALMDLCQTIYDISSDPKLKTRASLLFVKLDPAQSLFRLVAGFEDIPA